MTPPPPEQPEPTPEPEPEPPEQPDVPDERVPEVPQVPQISAGELPFTGLPLGLLGLLGALLAAGGGALRRRID